MAGCIEKNYARMVCFWENSGSPGVHMKKLDDGRSEADEVEALKQLLNVFCDGPSIGDFQL
jgi:hypothetical protein